MKQTLRDLRWILPSALGLGLLLSLLGPGAWWISWLAYSLLLFLGLLALGALWRSAGSSRALGLMLLLALVLRLGLGVALSYVLPPYGNDTEVQNAGYVFRDAYNRDTQSWELASSDDPLWKAFDKSYSTDQYGGMLFLSASFYRFLSPDAHRPWLVILVGALTAAIGVALAWKAARKAWGDKVAAILGWIVALFPEAVLLGSSQMREPFLMTFIAMAFWGVLVRKESRGASIAWMAGAAAGLLFFSPGMVALVLPVIAVWVWLDQGKLRISWRVLLIGAGVLVLGLVLFLLAVIHRSGGGSPWQALLDWVRFSVNYDIYTTEKTSDILWKVFEDLPEALHLPFVAAYGIAQPVLPAAVADPAVWPMRTLSILLALGWYAFVPVLVYAVWALWKTTDKHERRTWLWLWLASWLWIILSSLRAGGDQWDNPRYRAILLLFQAAVAAKALVWQRATHDRWLGRLLAMEGVFLVIFGLWYLARYQEWNQIAYVNMFVFVAAIVGISAVIFIWGIIQDRRRSSSPANRH